MTYTEVIEEHEEEPERALYHPGVFRAFRLYWQNNSVRPDVRWKWRGLHYELGDRVINNFQFQEWDK